MFYLILKSVACLAVFMLFYKLVLEQLSIHHFKRYYLILALISSVIIPFITFYNYVDVVVPVNNVISTVATMPQNFEVVEVNDEPINYVPILLWSLYAVGALFFAVKFTLHLKALIKQIRCNEKLLTKPYVTVLLPYKTIPHTFLNYIFLNKTDYFNQNIPKEVILHEQTHAREKHSLDILFIEFLQILFWFNPLLYFIKKDMKLNHEFLADAAVLKQGISTKIYQYTLLEYTTRLPKNSLANAINYPTLKKRFKIMKTQSSKTAVLLRTLLIAPVLALLVLNFSKTEIVEIEKPENKIDAPILIKENINLKKDNEEKKDTIINSEIIILFISQNPLKLKLNDKPTTIQTLKTDFIDVDTKKLKKIKFKVAESYITNKNLKLIFDALSGYITYFDLGEVELINESELKSEANKDQTLNPWKIKLDSVSEVNTENKTNPWNITYSVKSIEVTDLENTEKLIVNGTSCEKCVFEFTKKQIENLLLETESDNKITSFKFKIPGVKTIAIEGNTLNKKALANLSNYDNEFSISIFDIKSNDIKFPPVVITLLKDTDETMPNSPIKVEQKNKGWGIKYKTEEISSKNSENKTNEKVNTYKLFINESKLTLQDKPTTYESLSEDFKNLTGGKLSNLEISTDDDALNSKILNKISYILLGQVKTILTGEIYFENK